MYLKKHKTSWFPMDPNKMDINFNRRIDYSLESRRKNMKLIYSDAAESLPYKPSELRGEPVQLNVYVDSDQSGDKINRRSK